MVVDCLNDESSIGKTFEIISGETPIHEAVAGAQGNN